MVIFDRVTALLELEFPSKRLAFATPSGRLIRLPLQVFLLLYADGHVV